MAAHPECSRNAAPTSGRLKIGKVHGRSAHQRFPLCPRSGQRVYQYTPFLRGFTLLPQAGAAMWTLSGHRTGRSGRAISLTNGWQRPFWRSPGACGPTCPPLAPSRPCGPRRRPRRSCRPLWSRPRSRLSQPWRSGRRGRLRSAGRFWPFGHHSPRFPGKHGYTPPGGDPLWTARRAAVSHTYQFAIPHLGSQIAMLVKSTASMISVRDTKCQSSRFVSPANPAGQTRRTQALCQPHGRTRTAMWTDERCRPAHRRC